MSDYDVLPEAAGGDEAPAPLPFAPPSLPKPATAALRARAAPALDPALLAFPPTLPLELALGDSSAKEICDAYGIDRARFEQLSALPVFQKAYADAIDALQKEGMSFKVKARLQSEGLLQKSWAMIHDPLVAANVKADLIKATWRVAGFEPKANDQPMHAPLAIQINLNT